MDRFKTGDYGWFRFFTRTRGIKQGFSLYATVADTDRKYIHLIDNDDIEYYTLRSDVVLFERAEKPEIIAKAS